MRFNKLHPILLLALMVVQPWAHAAGDASPSHPAETVQAHCASGSADCQQAAITDSHTEVPSRHVHQQSCAKDSQDCDTRSRSGRSRADAEARDRHACRD